MLLLRRHAALFLAALCLAGPACAQGSGADDFATRAWETDEGMPHNGVNSILQRGDGFLWAGTQGGLVRFDGVEFVQRRSPLLANSRTSRIVELIEENPKTLLIACDASGLVRLTAEGFSIHPLGQEVGAGRKINTLFAEAPDVFWVLGNDRQMWRWDHGQILKFPPPAAVNVAAPGSFARAKDGTVYIARGDGLEKFDGKEIVPIPDIESKGLVIASSASGGLWVASSGGMWKWDGGIPAVVAGAVPWSGAPPSALLEDRDGAVWIGSKAQGLFRCAGTDFQLVHTSHPRLTALHEDREGNLWAGTSGGGLNRVQHARFHLLGEAAGWTPDIEGCVCEAPAGRIWFASGGLGLRPVDDGRFLPKPPIEGWPARAVPVFPDHEGQLWVGAYNQLLRINPDMSEPPVPVDIPPSGKYHAVLVARDGTVWAGGDTSLLVSVKDGHATIYDTSSGYSGVQAQALCEDSSGTIWVGTEEGELFRGQGGRFTLQPPPAGLVGSGIRALLADAQGHVWIGTGGGGLLVGSGGKFTALTEDQGLPDNVISQIVEDDFGALWCGSSRGLFKAAKSELLDCASGKTAAITAVKYGKEDGLAGFSAAANYQPSAWKTKDGHLLFVSRKGLVIADPGQQAGQGQGPQVHIEKFSVDGKVQPLQDAELPSAARKLDFQFTAPTFVSPEKIRFRYRMSGFESEWNEAGTQRSASYSQLKQGKYRFEVMACNSDLVWNPQAALLPIEIVPAWWETWWAHGLAVLAGAGLLTVVVSYWTNQRLKARLLELEAKQRIDQERSRIARDLHDGLGAGLTQIGMMAEELAEDVADMGEMKTYSSRLATRVRGIARDLDAAVWTVSPKNDTLAALSSYICQYAIEYFRETPVRCRLDIAPDIPDAPLSPDARHHLFLMAKEIMNNVLKHSGAAHLTLSMRAEDGRFHLEFRDDGHGFPAADAESCGRHGLRNVRERVMELGGTVAIDSSGSGTCIAIGLPLPLPK